MVGQMCTMAAKLLRKCVPWLPNYWENVCYQHSMAAHCCANGCQGYPIAKKICAIDMPWLSIAGQMCAMATNCKPNVCHGYRIARQMCVMAINYRANVCHCCLLSSKCEPWLPIIEQIYATAGQMCAMVAELLRKCVPSTCHGYPLIGNYEPWLPITD